MPISLAGASAEALGPVAVPRLLIGAGCAGRLIEADRDEIPFTRSGEQALQAVLASLKGNWDT